MVVNTRVCGMIIAILIIGSSEGLVRFVTPTNYNVQEGDSITLICQVDEGPLFFVEKEIVMVHRSQTGTDSTISTQGTLIPPYNTIDAYQLDISVNPVQVTLSINGVTEDLEGQFMCVVKLTSSDTVQESATTNLTVTGRGVRFVTPTNYNVQEGDSITLICQVDEGPLFFVEKEIVMVHRSQTGTDSTISTQGTLIPPYDTIDAYQLDISVNPVQVTLSINGVTEDLEGQFMCVVKLTSSDTVQESATTNLTVTGGGVRFVTPTNYNVQEGDSITLTCQVDEGPLFFVEKEIVMVHHSQTGTDSTISIQGTLIPPYNTIDAYQLDISVNPVQVTLSINGVTEDLEGQFICMVKLTSSGTVHESATTNLTVTDT